MTASFFIGGTGEAVVDAEEELASLPGVSLARAADGAATFLASALGSVTGVSNAAKSTADGGSEGAVVAVRETSFVPELDPPLCATQAI
jgi:hypothetical protein